MKTSLVGLKELRENMHKYALRVGRGESFIVLKKSRPIFKISSVDEDEELWETVIDFTKIKKGGISIKELLARL